VARSNETKLSHGFGRRVAAKPRSISVSDGSLSWRDHKRRVTQSMKNQEGEKNAIHWGVVSERKNRDVIAKQWSRQIMLALLTLR
jgi:hypothetical protein